MSQITNLELSPSQQEAQDLVVDWYKYGEDQAIFRLFGYAGTGKTTTIRSTIEALEFGFKQDWAYERLGGGDEDISQEEVDEKMASAPPFTVKFAAFTGKAALVMQKQGLPASTIHSLIYKPVPPNKVECDRIFAEIEKCTDNDERRRLRADLNAAKQYTYELREVDDSKLDGCKLLVLDECSMVNDEMLKDLMTFEVPMLVLGDPGQLPPIKGTGALIAGKPHALLTEVHRQAEDSPIIAYATRARNMITIPMGEMGTSKNVHRSLLTAAEMLEADQVLTGKNVTRQDLNKQMRAHLGYGGDYPVVGDKLICLRNDKKLGLFNGMLCEVVEVGDLLQATIKLKIRTELQVMPDYKPVEVSAMLAHFDAYHDKEALDNVKWWDRSGNQEFDYGYAITVHKSQGSQWENVVLYDDGFLNWKRKDRSRWLYTAITRAAERITIGG